MLTSTDLVHWTADAGSAEFITMSGDVQTVTFTLGPGLLNAPKLFIRVTAR